MERISIEERVRGFRKFYRMENDNGPLAGAFFGTYYPLRRYAGAASLPEGALSPRDLRPEEYLADYRRLHRLYEEAGGDFIWTAAAFWGVPWMEALAGCLVVADHETGSSRSLPPDECAIPSFDAGSPWVQVAVDFLKMLARESAGSFPLGTTLMRGFSDILAALYGSPEFVYRLVDQPAEMAASLERIQSLMAGFARAQLERIPDFHGGVGSYFYNMWMPGRGIWIQEDAAALLSPDLFDRFILPHMEAVIEKFDSTIVHLHPTSFLPVEKLCRTGLAAVELHIDKGGPSARDLLPVYRAIQERKPLVIWGDMNQEDLGVIRRNLDMQSLAVKFVVETQEEADRMYGILKG